MIIKVAAQPIAAADAAAPRGIGRSLSPAFGFATVRVYHRRAAELNRWFRSTFARCSHDYHAKAWVNIPKSGIPLGQISTGVPG